MREISKEGRKPSVQDYYVLNFSGGKDSTAMTLRWLELHKVNPVLYPLHEVIFCDTTMEWEQLLRHVARIQEIVEREGIPFRWLKSEKSFSYLAFEHKFKSRTVKQIYRDVPLVGYGWAGSRSRWCTAHCKQEVIAAHDRELSKQYNVIHLIGLAADETERLERKGAQSPNKRYPLAEWGWSEAYCLQYCYDAGYDWEGLYNYFQRVSCWCCPLQSLEDLRKLYHHFPEKWQELKELDAKTWRVFKGYYTVEDLEQRFILEDRYLSEGKSIKSRVFHAELKAIVPPRTPLRLE